MSTVIVVLHLLCAVFIIGPMAILPMTAMSAIRSGNGKQVLTLAKSTRLLSLLSLLTVVFGFGAMSMSKPQIPFSATWIWLSVLLYVVALGLALFVVVPGMQRAGEALAVSTTSVAHSTSASAGTAAPPQSAYSRIAASSGICSLCLVVIVILMVWEP